MSSSKASKIITTPSIVECEPPRPPDNASSLLLYYIYETSFRYWDTAYGATLTVVLLGLLGLLAIGQFFLFDRKVHYR